MQLVSGIAVAVAVAVAWASSCSSDLSLSLGAYICCRCGPKKGKKSYLKKNQDTSTNVRTDFRVTTKKRNSEQQQNKKPKILIKKQKTWGFPDGLVLRTWCFTAAALVQSLVWNWDHTLGHCMLWPKKKNEKRNNYIQGIPWWCSSLRIQHCHCCDSCHWHGAGSIPGAGSSACHKCAQKRKRRKKTKQNKTLCKKPKSLISVPRQVIPWVLEKWGMRGR